MVIDEMINKLKYDFEYKFTNFVNVKIQENKDEYKANSTIIENKDKKHKKEFTEYLFIDEEVKPKKSKYNFDQSLKKNKKMNQELESIDNMINNKYDKLMSKYGGNLSLKKI